MSNVYDLKAKNYTLEYIIKYYEKVLKNHNLEIFILKLIEKLNRENIDLRANNYALEYCINYYEKVLKNNNLEYFILERKTKNE